MNDNEKICKECGLPNGLCICDEIEKEIELRRLSNENQALKFLLKDVTERRMTIDILTYIEKLPDDVNVSARDIHKKLGYRLSDVQKVIDLLIEKKEKQRR